LRKFQRQQWKGLLCHFKLRNTFQHISGQEKLFDTGKKVVDVLEQSYKRINVKCCITHLALVDKKDNENNPVGLALLRKYMKFK